MPNIIYSVTKKISRMDSLHTVCPFNRVNFVLLGRGRGGGGGRDWGEGGADAGRGGRKREGEGRRLWA